MGTLNQQALDFLIAWREHGAPDPNRAHTIGDVVAEAQVVADFLAGDDATTIGSAVGAEIIARLEGLAQQMTDMTTALADFQTAVQADVQAKQALKDQVANLQAQVAALQGTSAADVAARDAALAQVADAANQVEAAAQLLNPLPVPTSVDTPPAAPPVDQQPPADVPPTDQPPTDAAPVPIDTAPPVDVPPVDGSVDPVTGQPTNG